MIIEQFPLLSRFSRLQHAFSTRSDFTQLQEAEADRAKAIAGAGFPLTRAVQAEQPHGCLVGPVLNECMAGHYLPGVDALVTRLIQVPLIIRVADCGPVYLYDPEHQSIGLAHSGRKGTEANIVGKTILAMKEHFGSQPENLIVQLGPCIRPPHYPVDFAAKIGFQAKAAGVAHFEDCGTCTADQVTRYYSYRAEKGNTGRMWAIMMLK